MSTTTEHSWFRAALSEHLLELLAREEEERFKTHALECESCAALLAVALLEREDWWDGSAHIHPSLLRTMAEGAAEPTKSAQAVVDTHLERCNQCRSRLAELRLAGVTATQPQPSPRSPARLGRNFPEWGWGIAGAAVGAVAMLVVLLPQAERQPAPSSEPQTIMAPEPVRVTLAMPVPVRLSSPSRSGGSADTATVELASEAQFAAISLPPLLVAPAIECDVELLDPQGGSLAHVSVAASRLQHEGWIVLDMRGVQPGLHVVVVRWHDQGGSHARRYPLLVTEDR